MITWSSFDNDNVIYTEIFKGAGTIYAYINTLKGASTFEGSTFKSARICSF